MCFRLWEYKRSQLSLFAHGIVTFLISIPCLFAYVTLAFLIAILLQLKTSLSNWDETFPLLLGNERTADRPWRGYISEVFIADRAISEVEVVHAISEKKRFASIGDSLLTAYRLTGLGSYQDEMGRLPDLVWRGEPQDVQQDEGVLLGPHHWLETATPTTYLTQRITKTSQLTLAVTAATNNTVQSGPARIVSLSGDPSHRNFTLGQEGSDLVFRLRTPLTGKNGDNPPLPLVVPEVFSTMEPVNLVITYNGSELLLYVNGVRTLHTLELTPGIAAFSYFFHLDASSMRANKILYYAFIFIPLGLLLSRIISVLRRRFVSLILTISGGILLSPIVFESILVSVSARDIKLDNLLLSTVFTAGSMVLFTFLRHHTIFKHSAELR